MVLKQESTPINIFKNSTYKLFITYRNSETITDTGIFTPSIQRKKYPKISNWVPDEIPAEDNLIYNIEIDADHFDSTIFITFAKLQDCLSSTGGFISLLKLILLFFFDTINKYKFSFRIFKDTYLTTNIVEFDMNKGILNNQTLKEIEVENRKRKKKIKRQIGLNDKSSINSNNDSHFESKIHNISNYSNLNKDSNKNLNKNSNKNKNKNSIKNENENYNKNEKFDNSENIENYDKLENIKKSDKLENIEIPDKSENIEIPDFEFENENVINEPKNSIFTNKINMENYLFNDNFSKLILPSSSRNFKTLELKDYKNSIIDRIKPENKEKIKNYYANKDNEINGKFLNDREPNKWKKNLAYSLKESKEPYYFIEKSSLINLKFNQDKSEISQNKKVDDNHNLVPNPNIISVSRFKEEKNEMRIKQKEEEDIKIEDKKEDIVKFKLNLISYIKSNICCTRKAVKDLKLDSMNLILGTIRNQMEVKSYLQMKEDFLLLKEIFLGKNFHDFFEDKYKFEEFYSTIKGRNKSINNSVKQKKSNRRSAKIGEIVKGLKNNIKFIN